MMHWKYLKAVLRHKWFVFLAGRGTVSLWQLVKHDWSKFIPAEWTPYARSFYGPQPRTVATRQAFDRAWLHHQHANPHHWQAWVLREDSGVTKVLPMPEKYRREMLADWRGAGRAYGNNDTAGWYEKNAARIMLHPETRALVEAELFGAAGVLAEA
jgi:hypothetical protein